MSIRKVHRQRFSRVDTAWLHMDTPTNLALICGVITFSEPLDFERLALTIERRLLVYPRFKQRVRESFRPFGLPYWETDPHFSLQNHLYQVRIPEPADHVTLQAVVSEMMSVPLDTSKPLWELHYVENYSEGGALICRLHHCIADGIALIQVLLSMADDTPDAPLPEVPQEQAFELSPLARMLVPAVKASRRVQYQLRKTRHVLHEGMETLIDPDRAAGMAKHGAEGGLALGKLLLMLPDQKTFLKNQCGIPKRAVWSKSIKVSEVKEIGKTLGGTINDILLTAMTGAVRQYLESRGEKVDGLNIRAIVPVNLRPPDEVHQLGNRFGLVFLSLPVGVEDQHKRLTVLKRRMDAIKDTPEAVMAFGILNFMGISPNRIENLIRNMFGLKGSIVITNLPGPPQLLYLAGARIDGLMFWVPTPANLGIGVSIFSYAGDVIVGVATDEGIIPDPEKIVEYFRAEFERMKQSLQPPDPIDEPLEEIEEIDVPEVQEIPAELETTADEGGEPEALGGESVEPLDEWVHEKEISEEPEPEAPSRAQEIADDQPEVIESVPGAESGKCQALTKKGEPCKNHALAGSIYCRVHS